MDVERMISGFFFFFLFLFLFWLPHGMWISLAKGQIQVTIVTSASAAATPDPWIPGQGLSRSGMEPASPAETMPGP